MKRFLCLFLCCIVLIMTGCGKGSAPSSNEIESTSSTQVSSDNQVNSFTPVHTLEELQPKYLTTPAFTGLDDEALLLYMEDDIYYQLLQEIDTDQYYIQSVDAVYVSKEYLQERAYNSQSNVFFGYTLAEADHFIGYGSPVGVEHFL